MLLLTSSILLVASCSRANFGTACDAAERGDIATAWEEWKASANTLLVGSRPKSDVETGRDAANRRDFATAWKEWKPSADKGDPEAQYNLGLMYLRGDGVSKNLEEAQRWFSLAASTGHQKALFMLNSSDSEFNRSRTNTSDVGQSSATGPATTKKVSGGETPTDREQSLVQSAATKARVPSTAQQTLGDRRGPVIKGFQIGMTAQDAITLVNLKYRDLVPVPSLEISVLKPQGRGCYGQTTAPEEGEPRNLIGIDPAKLIGKAKAKGIVPIQTKDGRCQGRDVCWDSCLVEYIYDKYYVVDDKAFPPLLGFAVFGNTVGSSTFYVENGLVSRLVFSKEAFNASDMDLEQFAEALVNNYDFPELEPTMLDNDLTKMMENPLAVLTNGFIRRKYFGLVYTSPDGVRIEVSDDGLTLSRVAATNEHKFD